MLRLRDIMTTDVLTVTPETSLRSAMELLESRHISGAPVVAGTRVVGIVSASDILAFTSTALQGPLVHGDAEGADAWDEPPGWDGEEPPDARVLEERWTGDDIGAVAADDREPASQRWDPLADHVVSDVMTWGVYALPPSSSVAAAAECMLSADVHRLLVLEEGRLAGIVTTMDLVRAIAEHRIARRPYLVARARPAE